MTRSLLDSAYCRPLARRLHEGHMRRLGIAPRDTGARLQSAQVQPARRLAPFPFETQLSRLLEENGAAAGPPVEMRDGWAIDQSRSLPHLDRVLEDAEEIIAERGGVRRTAEGTYRSYFQDMWSPADLERYPSFLDFATSTDVLATVSSYLRCIPSLSTTLPSGIRLVESNACFDDQRDSPHDSQLYLSTTIRCRMSMSWCY